MKNFFTKLKWVLISAACVCFAVTGYLKTFRPSAESAAEPGDNVAIPVDMYLIAGQSNAAGYSPVYDNETETFENVWYAGMTEKTLRSDRESYSSNSMASFASFKRSVKAGLGNNGSRIGPEYGMASVLNEMYADENRKAMIFKTAAGGTSLLDTTLELSDLYGNWYPRSLWAEGYTPNIETCSAGNDATGLLYRLFIENFRHVYGELIENGYAPVVKGMAWMQGCTDLYGSLDDYAFTLKTFICDLRNDLAEITGDQSLKNMPFVIGEIATTFNGNPNKYAVKMDECQRKVAEELGEGVSTVLTSDLIIVDKNDKPATGCPDRFHFCFNDAVTLGKRFGEKIVELSGERLVTVSAEQGTVKTLKQADNVIFTLIPDKHYKLKKFTVCGTDVTDKVKNNIYTLANAPLRVYVEAVFDEAERLKLEFADLGNAAGFVNTTKYGYEGDLLSVKIYVNEGYTLEKVMFNGEQMRYNAETKEYEILLTCSGKIEAVITKNGDNASDGNGDSEEKKGCGGMIRIGTTVGIAVCAAVACMPVLIKKKHRRT